MENKHQVEPLLYIDQLLVQKTVVFMQTDYKSNLQKQQNQKVVEGEKVTKADSTTHFNERSIEEKIHYLLHLPKEMPHLKCEIRTKGRVYIRSEEHTSELQSRGHLVCRLLLEKTK